MDAERYQRIKSIFLEALELSGSARSAFVLTATAGDVELRAEVESLLAHETEEDFLDPLLARDGSEPIEPASPDPPAIDALVGRTVLQYRIVRRLQAGGMGVVYLAEDVRLARQAALKFLKPDLLFDRDATLRFIREATAIAALAHPNICTLYGVEESADGQVFMAMAYYAGETLATALSGGPLPVASCLDIARQIGNGLAVAHAGGIVHRDVKPANIILADGVVKILDFGIATLADHERLTLHGAALGTPDYMSPERVRGGAADQRADIWSLGVVLYEMLTGAKPFKAVDLALSFDSEAAMAPPLAWTGGHNLEPELKAAVLRALMMNPDDRYQSMREFVRALDRIATAHQRHVRLSVAPFVGANPSVDARLAELVTEGVIDALSVAGGCVIERESTASALEDAVQPRRESVRAAQLTAIVSQRAGLVTIVASVRRGARAQPADCRAETPLSGLANAVADLSRGILQELGVRLTAEEDRQLAHRRRADSHAYLAHLRGRRCLERDHEEDGVAAWSQFESAITASPDAMGPLTHAAMVEACVWRLESGCEAGESLVQRARHELDSAVRLDAAAPEVQVAAADMAFRVEWAPETAECRLRSVLAARPGHIRAAVRLAECLVATGNGLDAAEVAKDVLHAGWSSSRTRLRAGRVLFFARQYTDAAAVFEDVVRGEPGNPVALLDLALTSAARRDHERARSECDRALDTHAGQAIVVAAAGNAAKARGDGAQHDTMRRMLIQLHHRKPVPACCFPLLDLSFGNTGRPIEYLEGFDRTLGVTKFLGFTPLAGSRTGFVSAVGLVAYLGVDPAFDCLYEAAGFQALPELVLNRRA